MIKGAYTEYIAIGADFLLPKPAGMSWEVAAGIMENYITGEKNIYPSKCVHVLISSI
jgi:NADPH:quinone reductase-like Zn-dependent oxidoreductase